MPQPLFRPEALAHQSERLWGGVILSQPLRFSLFAGLIMLFVVLAGSFLLTNTYHRKQLVSGILVPDKGVVSIGPASPGRLYTVPVRQDDLVTAGDLLFEVQLDETVTGNRLYSEDMLNNLENQEAQLLIRKRLEDEKLRLSLAKNKTRYSALVREVEQLQALLANEERLLSMKSGAYERAEALHQRRLIATVDVEARFGDLLQQTSSVENLNLRLGESGRQLAELDNEKHSLILTTHGNILAIEQELTALNQERIRLRASARNRMLSPLNGRVATVSGMPGQFVSAQQEVVSLIPANASLQAELFVPSSAIGFLQERQQVNMRYEAFPYQKFGVHSGHISRISKSVLLPGESPSVPAANEPVYRVVVLLDKQYVTAYGEHVELKAGMQLSANVILEERSLLEWLLEPLFSITGRS